MFRRLALIAVACALVVPAGLSKADEKAEKEKKVRKYLEVSGAVANMQVTIDSMRDQLDKIPNYPKDLAKKMQESFKVDELIELMIPIYMENLQSEDLDGLIAFYESPVGKRLAAATPKIVKASAEVGGRYGQEVAKKVIAELENDPNSELSQAKKHGNEASAIGALKTLTTAEAIFREGDKDGNGELDYGDLKALGKAKVIDSVLASGKKQGYLFQCAASTDEKEKKCFCWWATAFPEKPGVSGDRYFFTNQAGVIYYSTKSFEVDKESCEVPEGLKKLGSP
jgi:hypothetical protein